MHTDSIYRVSMGADNVSRIIAWARLGIFVLTLRRVR
jgi:hypothetical protein